MKPIANFMIGISTFVFSACNASYEVPKNWEKRTLASFSPQISIVMPTSVELNDSPDVHSLGIDYNDHFLNKNVESFFLWIHQYTGSKFDDQDGTLYDEYGPCESELRPYRVVDSEKNKDFVIEKIELPCSKQIAYILRNETLKLSVHVESRNEESFHLATQAVKSIQIEK